MKHPLEEYNTSDRNHFTLSRPGYAHLKARVATIRSLQPEDSPQRVMAERIEREFASVEELDMEYRASRDTSGGGFMRSRIVSYLEGRTHSLTPEASTSEIAEALRFQHGRTLAKLIELQGDGVVKLVTSKSTGKRFQWVLVEKPAPEVELDEQETQQEYVEPSPVLDPQPQQGLVLDDETKQQFKQMLKTFHAARKLDEQLHKHTKQSHANIDDWSSEYTRLQLKCEMMVREITTQLIINPKFTELMQSIASE